MDAREFLDQIAENPPKALNGGCARVALSPLLWHFRLVGMYHEHGKYKDWAKLSSSFKHNSADPQLKVRDKTKEYVQPAPSVLERAYTRTRSTNQASHYTISARTVTSANTAMKVYNDGTERFKTIEERIQKPQINSIVLDPLKVINGLHQNRDNDASRKKKILYQSTQLSSPKVRNITTSFGDTWTVGRSPSFTKPQENHESHKKSCFQALWSDRTYAAIVLLILWGYCFRCSLFLFSDIDVPLMSALNFVSWLFLVSSQATVIFVSCTKRNHFFEFFTKWAEIYQDPITRALGIRGVAPGRHTQVIIAFQWILSFINSLSAICIMLMDETFSGHMNILMYINGHRSVAAIVVSAICMAFCSFAWIIPISFIVAICHHVTIHFEEFNQIMKLHIFAAQTGFPKKFNLMRERHLAMCETVCVLDRYIRVILGIFYSCSIGTACIIIYQLVNVRLDISVACISVFWLTTFLGFMAVATYHMANVNNAMHSVNDELYTLQTSHITREELAQLQMFMAKVNGPAMGFSVLGLVIVTRELMLTLFSLFITYSVVLLQFQ